MIRILFLLVVALLVVALGRSFMSNSRNGHPIDVDPVSSSSGRGSSHEDEDIIDVEPLN